MNQVIKPGKSDVAAADLERLRQVSEEANRHVSSNVFGRYRMTKSQHSSRRQLGDLNLFAGFLKEVADVELSGEDFFTAPRVWGSVSAGLVETFRVWMLNGGYATNSINVRMNTIKTYARLSFQAGHLDRDEHLRIQAIKGYGHGEARRVDEKRSNARRGHKKEEPTLLSREDVQNLKTLQGDQPVNFRDRLLMCLLLDHGLRCEEVVILTIGSIDTHDEMVQFYRPKVTKTQRHKLSQDTLCALREYLQKLESSAARNTPLLRASNKSGKLLKAGLTTRAINKRVGQLGRALGVDGLSPHDCRHTWSTSAAKNSSLNALQQAGGWSSPAMPMRYIHDQEIANEGVQLDY